MRPHPACTAECKVFWFPAISWKLPRSRGNEPDDWSREQQVQRCMTIAESSLLFHHKLRQVALLRFQFCNVQRSIFQSVRSSKLMGHQIGNLRPVRQSGDHKAKAIEKSLDTGVEPAVYGLLVYCFMFERITMSR